jgi:hypothetical protein
VCVCDEAGDRAVEVGSGRQKAKVRTRHTQPVTSRPQVRVRATEEILNIFKANAQPALPYYMCIGVLRTYTKLFTGAPKSAIQSSAP